MGEAKWWWNMKRPEIEEHVKKDDIVLLPIGSTEQHGLHLPAGTDYYIAAGIAKIVSERSGVIIAPPMAYGSHPYIHFGYQGTLPIRQTTLIQLVRDVIISLFNNGFIKIIIINGHGQWWTLNTAIQDIALEVNAFMAVATWQEIANPTITKVLETPVGHAEESETALALFLFPELVDMSKAQKGTRGPGIIDTNKFCGQPVFGGKGGAFCYEGCTAYRLESKAMKVGVFGDPTVATREKGEKVVNATADFLCDLVDDLRNRYKVGEIPQIKPELKVDY